MIHRDSETDPAAQLTQEHDKCESPCGAANERIRVGFLSCHNPLDPNAFSGTPHSAYKALREVGIETIDLSGQPLFLEPSIVRTGIRKLPGFQHAKPLWRATRNAAARIKEELGRPWDYQRTIRETNLLSARVQTLVDAADVDILFGICMSTVLYRLETTKPIVYVSDTTAKLVNTSYPVYSRLSDGYHRACDEIERTALHKCEVFVAAAKCAAASAKADYGLPPSRVRIVEFGAHVLPSGVELSPSAPRKDDLELVLVAADPIRKRLELCIEVAEILKRRGWAVRLNYVGPDHPSLKRTSVVTWWGRLSLGDPADRQVHQQVLQRSHWMLLPSTAEAFGIAPCEAAHFGRPSIVTDVGGLPTVVEHERTGVVVPVDAPAQAYADAVEQFSIDPERYATMSHAALCRARTVLSWPVWAKRIKAIFIEVLKKGDTCQPKK